jgi:hypothetical protein
VTACRHGRASSLLGGTEEIPTTLELVFAFGLLAVAVGVFLWASRRLRKGGGGAEVGLLGGTFDMLSSDQRKAGETIIKRNAGESEEDESSSEPREPEAGHDAG